MRLFAISYRRTTELRTDDGDGHLLDIRTRNCTRKVAGISEEAAVERLRRQVAKEGGHVACIDSIRPVIR